MQSLKKFKFNCLYYSYYNCEHKELIIKSNQLELCFTTSVYFILLKKRVN